GHGLAASELRAVALQHDDLAAELAHAELEGNPGAGRGLLEDHRQRLAGQRPLRARAALLEGQARLEHPAQRGAIDPVEIEEVARGRAGRAGHAQAARAPAGQVEATRSRMDIASAMCCSSMISGGSRRTTLSPASTLSRPASRSRATTSP